MQKHFLTYQKDHEIININDENEFTEKTIFFTDDEIGFILLSFNLNLDNVDWEFNLDIY